MGFTEFGPSGPLQRSNRPGIGAGGGSHAIESTLLKYCNYVKQSRIAGARLWEDY